jgi:hypothetical protein
MGARAGIWGTATVVAWALMLGTSTLGAKAADIIEEQHHPHTAADGWQAGTCKTEAPTTCSVDTPEQFFTQAAGHPPVGFTQFIVKHEPVEIGPLEFGEKPVGNIKHLRVDLPIGLSVNPQATEKCSLATFESNASSCPLGSAVGESQATASLGGVALPPLTATVYNLEPSQGEPALFGFSLLESDVYLKAGVDTNGPYREWKGDYHEYFTIEAPKSPIGEILKDRLVFNGQAGNGTFLTTPSTCHDPEVAPFEHVYSTYLRADSYEEEEADFPNSSPFIESPLPPKTMPTGCDEIPFKPSISVEPETTQTDSPDGPAVEVKVPFEPGAELANSDLQDASVSLPQGMGLNPSAASGLRFCTDAELGKGTSDPVACPPGSTIGTVSIDTPPLPDSSLTGNVYLGQQLSRDPTSGDEYRIFVDAESARYGISVRLIGNVSANPQTGQLTATFAKNPQVPFSSFQLRFDGGPTATLTSPPTCGPNTATSRMTPWSGDPDATPSGGFTLTTAPGGGACAKTLAERPFAPGFAAKTTNPKGGAYSQLEVGVTRPNGDQELKGVNVDLPPGMTAKLAGIPYCPPSAIAAAAAASGAAELARSSCPEGSLIGSAAVDAGSGPSPLRITGKAFLAGPYNGAPLSLVVVTPATAGPFDLGSVVVRVALHVNPETAQVEAVSDPIPHVFGGALLDIDSISVHVDRKQFALNPTNCSPMAVAGTLRGGGADPTNPAAFSSDPVSVPFQVNGCESLGFKPKLHLRLFGGTHRAASPKLRAVLEARAGDANISRAAVSLPHALFLKQSSLNKVCTRVQFAAGECPAGSIYGFARAFTPLLGKPLEGPVYLRSSGGELPDMVAALNGQVDIDLVGHIDSFHGGIRTTFATVPDVPVSKFVLTVRGGRRGLLVNSLNLCQAPVKAIVRIRAQNGKKANRHSTLRTPCRRRHGKSHRRKHAHRGELRRRHG